MSQKYRIGKPRHIPRPVVHRIIERKQHMSCGFDIRLVIACRISHPAGGRIANLDGPFRVFAQINHRLPVRTQGVVGNLKRIFYGQLFPGRIDAVQMPEPHETLRLIQCDKILAKVGKVLRHHLRILAKPPDNLLVLPAAFILQRLRQFPVIHRNIRRDAVFLHLQDHIPIKRDTLFVHASRALRQDSRPV